MNKVRRFAFAATLVFLCLSFARPLFAAGRAECLSMRSRILRRAVAFCVLFPPSYDTEKARRYPVLYFLHGLGDNEQMLVHPGGFSLLEDQGHLGEFLVVTPNAGTSFYINSRDGRVRYEDFLIREFLPFIEHRYRTQAGRKYRGIAGISMGGYGALRFAFRYPELFGSVSAHSAALIEHFPAITITHPEQSPLLRMLGTAFGSPPDRRFWERNSPFALARTVRPTGLKIYFDCGSEDEYGFNAGARAFHNLLVSRGIPHDFHLYPGGHNWLYFAEHLPASLQFHSHSFGLSPSGK
jgi:S-formylglutathione hydrolase FrmB